MNIYRADIHIHTVLSPCGDLDMSPHNIVAEAVAKGLDIIGITDHNTTRHCKIVSNLAEKKGIYVMQGAEVTTKEEVHSLVFFENTGTLNILQKFLDENLPDIKNNPLLFGDQVQIDENENIVYTEERLLYNAINISIGELEDFVHIHGGLFIPAHVDRMKNSIYSQLGIFPSGLKADALEISRRSTPKQFSAVHPEINAFPLVTNSDSHVLESIGTAFTDLLLERLSFDEIRMAFKAENKRKVLTR
jgi:3',5'-nucleoside bisphosphate phosphatase